jgi:hypothetical protein
MTFSYVTFSYTLGLPAVQPLEQAPIIKPIWASSEAEYADTISKLEIRLTWRALGFKVSQGLR